MIGFLFELFLLSFQYDVHNWIQVAFFFALAAQLCFIYDGKTF